MNLIKMFIKILLIPVFMLVVFAIYLLSPSIESGNESVNRFSNWFFNDFLGVSIDDV